MLEWLRYLPFFMTLTMSTRWKRPFLYSCLFFWYICLSSLKAFSCVLVQGFENRWSSHINIMSLSSLLRLKLVIETLTKSFLLTERINLTIIFHKYVSNYLCRIEPFFNLTKITIFKTTDDYNTCAHAPWQCRVCQ